MLNLPTLGGPAGGVGLSAPPPRDLRIPFAELLAMMRARPDWRWSFWLKQNSPHVAGDVLDDFGVQIVWRCPCDRNEILITERLFPIHLLVAVQARGGERGAARYIEQELVRVTDRHIEKHTARWRRLNIPERAGYGEPVERCRARGCRKPLQGEAELLFAEYAPGREPEPFIRVVTPGHISVWQRTPGRPAPTLPERRVELYCLPCGDELQKEPEGQEEP